MLFGSQACQGDKLDGGIRLESRTEVDGNNMGYTIPIHADFLIAYSTIPGICKLFFVSSFSLHVNFFPL